MKNKKGFTIVELVIVIAVIAILAAVLIPTFSGVIQKSNESSALQEATSTMKSTLAMSDYGTIADNTQFIVVKGSAIYKFSYEGNQIKSIKNDAALPTGWNTIVVNKDHIDTTNGIKLTTDGESLVKSAFGSEILKGYSWTTYETGYKLTKESSPAIYVLVNTDYSKAVVTVTQQTISEN